MAGTGITFDSNSLQTANIITDSIDHEGLPAKNDPLYALAHFSGSKIPLVTYPNKSVKVTGKVIDSTIAALDSRLDTFRKYFTGQDKNLDIDYNSSTRRYIATLGGITIDRPGGLLFANFELDFTCTQPYGQDTATTTAVNDVGKTTTPNTSNHTFAGTAPWQRPVFTYTLTAVTGGTAANVVIGNNGTGQQITVTRTWANADVLVIDVSARTVTVNGVAIAFSGAFPEFAPGSQTITYSDTFTTRTYTLNGVYYPLYF